MYSLPNIIREDPTCEDLVELYEVIVARLRAEAASTRMNTIQELLLERIATNYVILRYRERVAAGEGGFEHTTAAKDFNSFWLAMTREFNHVLRADGLDEAERDSLVQRVGGAIASALDELHPDVAGPLRQRFAEALQNIGL